MVLKHGLPLEKMCPKFENDVEMYGAQTVISIKLRYSQFENDVEMYGAQTL